MSDRPYLPCPSCGTPMEFSLSPLKGGHAYALCRRRPCDYDIDLGPTPIDLDAFLAGASLPNCDDVDLGVFARAVAAHLRLPCPWWDIPARPILPGMQASLRYGSGVIMRATFARGVWRVDWGGSYPTLNAAAASRGFPPDAGPHAYLASQREVSDG